MSSEKRPSQPRCTVCGKPFTVSPAIRQRYPNWTPTRCPACFHGKKAGGGNRRKGGGAAPAPTRRPASAGSRRAPASPPPRNEAAGQGELFSVPAAGGAADSPAVRCHSLAEIPHAGLRLALQEVLDSFGAGPKDGIFTDGGCEGNPGPGGWAAARVEGGELRELRYGREAQTTNNRMELRALIAGFRMVGPQERVAVFSDSDLCVKSITQWAPGWASRGWRRKGGAVKNLDLVRPLYELSLERPGAKLTWVKAHNGTRWNEFVDVAASTPL